MKKNVEKIGRKKAEKKKKGKDNEGEKGEQKDERQEGEAEEEDEIGELRKWKEEQSRDKRGYFNCMLSFRRSQAIKERKARFIHSFDRTRLTCHSY